jgi:hypothetical protein
VIAASSSPALILPGRSEWRPEMSFEVRRIASDLLERFRAITAFGALEAARRQPSAERTPLVVAETISFLANFVYARELVRRGLRPGILAGSIDFEQALSLVRSRALIVAEAIARNPLRIVRVEGADVELVAELCAAQGDVWPATYDGPRHAMIGGEARALDRMAPKLKQAGAKRIVLVFNSGGLHTAPMLDARDAMVKALADVNIEEPRIPVVCGVSARVEEDPERWRELLADQIHSPVRWYETLQALPRDVPVIECGGGKLIPMVLELWPEREVFAVDTLAALDAALGR